MAAPTGSGWTGASIAPSYTVLNRILGPASGTANAAATPAGGGSLVPPAVTPTFGNFTGAYGGIPSVPAKNPLTSGSSFSGSTGGLYGGGGRGGGGLGGPTGIMDQAGNPIYTPEQAYSQYLSSLGSAIMTTPQQQALHNILNLTNQASYAPQASGVGGALSMAPTGYNLALQNQLNALRVAFPSVSPYSTAYGTPVAQAPAPTPAWGYPTAYGQQVPGPQPQRAAPVGGIGQPMGGIGYGFM